MSVEIVKSAMLKFLADPTPSVLCIKGRWGTGKTYAWEEAVQQAAKSKQMAIKKYAYLSLFGIKDSSDIFQSVFANTSDFAVLNEGRRFPNEFGGFKLNVIYRKLKSLPAFAAEHATVPYIAGLGGVARALLSNLVNNTVVCLDDFERKSKNVTVNEIMGTITQLRDARQCKVVLILNENSLDEAEKTEFARYAEKVINKEILFVPSPEDSAVIAFPGTEPLSQDLREACVALAITNIRVMNRIGSCAQELAELLKGIDSAILKSVLRSLVVLVWSIVSPAGEGAPELKYLVEKRQDQYFGIKKVKFNDDEDRWGALLTEYGFTQCDDFDLLMIEDIKNGFFNEQRTKSNAEIYLKDAQQARAQAAIEAAWKPFHASFDDNSQEVAKSIFNGCTENIVYLAPINLNSAVSILKDIGFPEQASDLLAQYVAAHDGKDIFDRSRYAFGSSITDPDVIKAFDEKAQRIRKPLPTPLEASARIYKGSWSPEDEESLAKLSVDNFVTLFRETKGSDRSTVVLGCLEFRKFSPASPRQKAIAANAEAALIHLGQEVR